ncbi:MAG TPA: response regulator, partial [Clostridia bacterium]
MRLKKDVAETNFNVILVDDEQGILDSMSVFLKRSGYRFKGFTNPFEAIESIRNNKYDLLILDYIMDSIHGNEVVEKIRSFNSDLYILLLTGHKDLAPPIETLKSLDIQGYCEKSDRFDQLLLLIESARKSVDLMRKNIRYEEGLNKILQAVPKIYQLHPIGKILKEILKEILPFAKSENAFILVDDLNQSFYEKCLSDEGIYRGIGSYEVTVDEFLKMLDPYMMESIGMVRMDKKLLKIEGGVILPLISDVNGVLGVIYIESVDFEEGLKLLEIYSVQATLSIKNAFLHSLVNIKNNELNKTYEELKTRYFDTIQALRLTVDAKDVYTRGHSDRVAYYAVRLGEAIGLSDADLELLKLSGIFHDIG